MPEAIDAAGFDAVVIRGKSKAPMVLSIYPGGALFHDLPYCFGVVELRILFQVSHRITRRKHHLTQEGFLHPCNDLQEG